MRSFDFRGKGWERYLDRLSQVSVGGALGPDVLEDDRGRHAG
jgi:hypothetical protein